MLLLLSWMAGAACDSRSATLLGPGQGAQRCDIAVSTPGSTIDAAGGTGSLAVTTARECQWSVTTEVAWLSITSGSSGQGSGAVSYSAAPNRSTTARRGALVIGGQRVEVVQDAATCTVSVSPGNMSIAPGGGETRITISTEDFCSWTATSQAPWITVASDASGTGPAEILLRIVPNPGGERSGIVRIAGTDVIVNQASSSTCALAVVPTVFDSVPPAGSPLEVTVTAPQGCAWTASSAESWIQIVEGANGTGNGRVRITIQPNSGAPRSGNLTVAGRTVRVDQRGSDQCNFSISPARHDAPATGGPVQVQITTNPGCAWAVRDLPSWISADTTSGTGSRPITLTIQANSGSSARSASLAIATQPFTVNQVGTGSSCSYSLSSTTASVSNTTGTTSFAITATTGCPWNAASSNTSPWLTISSSSSGTGNGSVNVSFSANTGALRTGIVVVTGQDGFGQNFTVTQAGCGYSLSSTSANVPIGAGTTSFGVTASSGCTWTAGSNAPWLTVTSGSPGTGNGTVNLSFTANTGTQRSGTVTVAGAAFTQNFTVTQAGCTYSLSSTSANVSSAAGTVSFGVTTNTGCTWTAVSNNTAWLTIGSVSQTTAILMFTANTGAERTGTVTVMGAGFTGTFSVIQAGAPCTYQIDPMAFPNVLKTGGTILVNVKTASHCAWNVSGLPTSPMWITANPLSGMGQTGTIVIVQPNLGPARNHTIQIAGQPFMVSQLAGP